MKGFCCTASYLVETNVELKGIYPECKRGKTNIPWDSLTLLTCSSEQVV